MPASIENPVHPTHNSDLPEAIRQESQSPCIESPPSELPDSSENQSPATATSDSRRVRLPAMLISTIIHSCLLLMLAFLTAQPRLGNANRFVVEALLTSDVAEMAAVEMPAANGGESSALPAKSSELDRPQPIAVDSSSLPAISEVLSDASADRASASHDNPLDALFSASESGVNASFAVSGVEGRSSDARRQLALARGGSLASERAVEMALEWLAAHQRPAGDWSLVHNDGQCNGRCPNPGSRERYSPAATGLALLAFLGAGQTHREGKYQTQVKSAIYYLLQIQEETAQGGSFMHSSDKGMYNHGIATFALCEAYQMTGDADLKQPAQRAIDFISNSQNQTGGWGYFPKSPGDLTISGWQVMALKSAVAAGLYVRPDIVLRIDKFLDSQTIPPLVYYGYRGTTKHATCTAIGLLLRLFRSWPNTDPRIIEGSNYLARTGISNSDIYFNYYVTLLLFHTGLPSWPAWNERMREHLIRTQAISGHEAGSWYFENVFGKEGGRLYTTAMCAMTLEVYYRFQPLYLHSDRNFEF